LHIDGIKSVFKDGKIHIDISKDASNSTISRKKEMEIDRKKEYIDRSRNSSRTSRSSRYRKNRNKRDNKSYKRDYDSKYRENRREKR